MTGMVLPKLRSSLVVVNPVACKVQGLELRRNMADNGRRLLFGFLSGMFVADF
jgi:hypothetical protein